jgi:undecaprenyl-diphosphatase
MWPLYYVVAIVVAASRVHVRIHHASDVLGGMGIGIALGELTRHLVPVGTRAAHSQHHGTR